MNKVTEARKIHGFIHKAGGSSVSLHMQEREWQERSSGEEQQPDVPSRCTAMGL